MDTQPLPTPPPAPFAVNRADAAHAVGRGHAAATNLFPGAPDRDAFLEACNIQARGADQTVKMGDLRFNSVEDAERAAAGYGVLRGARSIIHRYKVPYHLAHLPVQTKSFFGTVDGFDEMAQTWVYFAPVAAQPILNLAIYSFLIIPTYHGTHGAYDMMREAIDEYREVCASKVENREQLARSLVAWMEKGDQLDDLTLAAWKEHKSGRSSRRLSSSRPTGDVDKALRRLNKKGLSKKAKRILVRLLREEDVPSHEMNLLLEQVREYRTLRHRKVLQRLEALGAPLAFAGMAGMTAAMGVFIAENAVQLGANVVGGLTDVGVGGATAVAGGLSAVGHCVMAPAQAAMMTHGALGVWEGAKKERLWNGRLRHLRGQGEALLGGHRAQTLRGVRGFLEHKRFINRGLTASAASLAVGQAIMLGTSLWEIVGLAVSAIAPASPLLPAIPATIGAVLTIGGVAGRFFFEAKDTPVNPEAIDFSYLTQVAAGETPERRFAAMAEEVARVRDVAAKQMVEDRLARKAVEIEVRYGSASPEEKWAALQSATRRWYKKKRDCELRDTLEATLGASGDWYQGMFSDGRDRTRARLARVARISGVDQSATQAVVDAQVLGDAGADRIERLRELYRRADEAGMGPAFTRALVQRRRRRRSAKSSNYREAHIETIKARRRRHLPLQLLTDPLTKRWPLFKTKKVRVLSHENYFRDMERLMQEDPAWAEKYVSKLEVDYCKAFDAAMDKVGKRAEERFVLSGMTISDLAENAHFAQKMRAAAAA